VCTVQRQKKESFFLYQCNDTVWLPNYKETSTKYNVS